MKGNDFRLNRKIDVIYLLIMVVILALVVSVATVHAAPIVYNNDTTLIREFGADSLKYGRVANLTSSAYNTIVVQADDTVIAGFDVDSIKFDFGYRIGWQVPNSNVRTDTTWSPLIRVGTFSTVAADTAGKWVNETVFDTDSSTGEPAVIIGLMDTLNVLGYAVTASRFTNVTQGHFIQPWIKGLTGNRTSDGFVKVRTQLIQLNYLPTRAQ